MTAQRVVRFSWRRTAVVAGMDQVGGRTSEASDLRLALADTQYLGAAASDTQVGSRRSEGLRPPTSDLRGELVSELVSELAASMLLARASITLRLRLPFRVSSTFDTCFDTSY